MKNLMLKCLLPSNQDKETAISPSTSLPKSNFFSKDKSKYVSMRRCRSYKAQCNLGEIESISTRALQSLVGEMSTKLCRTKAYRAIQAAAMLS